MPAQDHFLDADPRVPTGVYSEAALAEGALSRCAEEFARDAEAQATEVLGRCADRAKQAGVACAAGSAVTSSPYEASSPPQPPQCDLIFMASHGRRGFSGLLLGAETHKVYPHRVDGTGLSTSRRMFSHLERPAHPLPGWRQVLADFGPRYAANGFIGWLFAATAPVAIILSVGTRGGLSEAELASWMFGVFFVNGLISILFCWLYRQPLAFFWTIPGTVLVGPGARAPELRRGDRRLHRHRRC